MAVIRTCETCGKTYRTKTNHNIRFCSRECWRKDHAAQTTTLVCEYCGKTYTKPTIRIGLGKFCSRQCAAKGRKQPPPAQTFTYTCQRCGKTFTRERNKPYKFCSHQCSHKGRKQPRGITLAENTCEQCGQTYQRTPATIGKFCSSACWGKWHAEHDSGENSPFWKGGTTEYRGPNWRKQKAAARKRDGHRCQHCGVSEDEIGQHLDVHHVKPFREFGYIPDQNDNYRQANKLSNLLTLCRSCHLKVEPRTPPQIVTEPHYQQWELPIMYEYP